MRVPFYLFIIVPFIEILLLLEVSDNIGGLWTISLVILTAFIGVRLLKLQGISTLTRFQGRLQRGELPAQEIVEGLLIAFSGALLLTPGFLTDIIGFSCLLPPLRAAMARKLLASGKFTAMGGGFSSQSSFYYRGSNDFDQEGEIIPGEYRNEDEPSEQIDKPDK
ncbi:MAG: FxsA family protein [Pseudohongiellaceae bacterium]|nr:FxsA family protein [Pseudohongiellaceae bacterium]